MYGMPALPVSANIFRRQRVDESLLKILLRELDKINASFYYDNNCFEAIWVMRGRELFENLLVFFHYKFQLKEVSLFL